MKLEELSNKTFNTYKPSELLMESGVPIGDHSNCLLTEISTKSCIEMKNTTQHTIKRKLAGPFDKRRKFHPAYYIHKYGENSY